MELLDKINNPAQLKKLNPNELPALAEEIRRVLVATVSKTGGHLASNLGVCELTIALHYCFNTPLDKIIWDVGHQSYVHKILTERKEGFSALRQMDGLSGFPKTSESEHDCFGTGHASTSISAALGIAVARDLKGDKHHVVAVIGDGSMTGGLAFEGLNHAGRLDTNLLVILNDNQMSIDKNVGAMSNYLSNLRTAPGYIGVKADIKKTIGKIPLFGGKIVHAIEKTKAGIKYTLVKHTVFDEYGFNYIGPVDGHNIAELIKVLFRVKKLSGPILLHVCTIKGKGCLEAENAPIKFHGVAPNEENGESSDPRIWNTYSDVFGKSLVHLAEKDKRITAVTAAMPQGTGLAAFAVKFPKKFFDAGIAESHAVTFAAGLANNGFIPIVAIYSTFLQRAYDQILHDVALQNLPVVFGIDRAGIVGGDGETHQGLYDLAYLSHIPNMTIMSPKNRFEFIEMLKFAVKLGSPVAIRYPRAAATGMFKEYAKPLELGKSEIITEGKNILLIALGEMVETAFEVSRKLLQNNISVCIINARFVKPFDDDIIKRARNFKYVFTLESAVYAGGLGQIIAGKFTENRINVFFRAFTYPDEFLKQGAVDEIKQFYKMDATGIFERICGFYENKNSGNNSKQQQN